MAVTVQHSHDVSVMQIEHRTGETGEAGVTATGVYTKDVPVHGKQRLFHLTGQALAGAGDTGEQTFLYKVVYPYGQWKANAATLGEALSADELTGIALDSEGSAHHNGITAGTILRITGVVASDNPDRVITMVVRVTGVTLTAGSADTIDVEHIWNSVSRACDTGATLEKYIPGSQAGVRTEDIWRDVSADTLGDEALDDDETAITLAAEGDAAAAGIVAGSIIRYTATETGESTATEIMLVTSVTLTGCAADVLNVVRGFWGSTAKAFDDDNSKIEVLEGRITNAISVDDEADNGIYAPTTMDDSFMDFVGPREAIRSILVDPTTGDADCRTTLFFVGYE